MKIYTEEQLKQVIANYNTEYFVSTDELLEDLKLAPIELPSDEEIEQEAYYKVSDDTENPYASFKSGAKWMKEQILKQNK